MSLWEIIPKFCVYSVHPCMAQVAGAAAVSVLGGPACPMLMGRPDKGSADITSGLPNICDNANTGVGRFTTMGFRDPVKAVTVLSGAHNVGNSRATQRGTCSRGLVSDNPRLNRAGRQGPFAGHWAWVLMMDGSVGGRSPAVWS